MPWSKLDIINLAFNKLNKRSVNAVADSGEFADSANRAFDMLYPSEISGFSWRFATRIQQLSVLVAPPILTRWQYQLQLPANYLAVVRTYPRTDFQIYEENVIFCNRNDVLLEYRFLPQVTRLPAYFVHFFCILLASWFADAVANNDDLSKKLLAEADYERGKALFTDSQSHPISAMVSQPLIDVRGGGGTWGFDGSSHGWG